MSSSAEHSTRPTVLINCYHHGQSPTEKNTLIVIEASSAGKTRVITNPLVMLARFVGRISNSNTSSAFAWMDCLNMRLSSIDEALMAPRTIEKFKNVVDG